MDITKAKAMFSDPGIYLVFKNGEINDAILYEGMYEDDGSENQYPFTCIGSDGIYTWKDITADSSDDTVFVHCSLIKQPL